ncbi:MAG: potassium transporter, partial [Wohlfahrtiimonas sp.]
MDKQLAIIFKIMGMLMMAFSFTFLIPVGISFIYSDGQFHYFISAFLITMVLGALLWFPFRKVDYELKTRHGFIIVALFWSVL